MWPSLHTPRRSLWQLCQMNRDHQSLNDSDEARFPVREVERFTQKREGKSIDRFSRTAYGLYTSHD